MLAFLPGIAPMDHKLRSVIGAPRQTSGRKLPLGIIYILSRESLTARQVAARLNTSIEYAWKEIHYLEKEGKIKAISTETVISTAKRGRKRHVAKIYRAVR